MSRHRYSKTIQYLAGLFMGLTMTFAQAALQVMGLRDTHVSEIQTPVQLAPAGIPTDSFCVVSTEGSVRLTFTNSAGTDPATRSWRAVNITGEKIRYRQYVTVAGDALPLLASDPAAAPIIVSAARAAKSAAGCGAGNVSKGIIPVDFTPAKTLFRDTITLTVTPL